MVNILSLQHEFRNKVIAERHTIKLFMIMKHFTKIFLSTLMATVFAGSMFAQSEETNESRVRVTDNSVKADPQSREPQVSVVSREPRHNEIVDPRFGVPAPQMYDYPATKAQEDMVVKVIKNTSFDDNKFEIAKVCLALRPMSTDCIMRIAKLFSFDSSRLKFLEYAYEFCYDKYGYCRMARKYFSFSSNYQELERYVEKYDKRHHISSAVIEKPRPGLHAR